MEQVAIEEAMIESADPIPIWGGQRWQGSVDVDEEGWEEDVEKGGWKWMNRLLKGRYE